MGDISGTFTWEPNLQVAGVTVTFTADAQSETAGGTVVAITKYEWQFGEGAPLVNGEDSDEYAHVFVDPGTYDVGCRVTDADGAKATQRKDVEITKRYRATGRWDQKPIRATVILTEYAAGNAATGNSWRLPFDTLNRDYTEIAQRFKPLIENPDVPPTRAILDEIEDQVNEAMKE